MGEQRVFRTFQAFYVTELTALKNGLVCLLLSTQIQLNA